MATITPSALLDVCTECFKLLRPKILSVKLNANSCREIVENTEFSNRW